MAREGLRTYLVTYDVSTETRAGRRRLSRAARICLDHGQRVQKSVFECKLTAAGFERLSHKLRELIEPDCDSVRIYRLPADRRRAVTVLGVDTYQDYEGTLLL